MFSFENFIKGSLTSVLGLIMLGFASYGWYTDHLDNYEGMSFGIASFALLFMRDKLPDFIGKFFNAVIEKFFGGGKPPVPPAAIILILMAFGSSSFAQISDATLTTNNTNEIKNKTYTPLRMSTFLKQMIDSKVNRFGTTIDWDVIFETSTATDRIFSIRNYVSGFGSIQLNTNGSISTYASGGGASLLTNYNTFNFTQSLIGGTDSYTSKFSTDTKELEFRIRKWNDKSIGLGARFLAGVSGAEYFRLDPEQGLFNITLHPSDGTGSEPNAFLRYSEDYSSFYGSEARWIPDVGHVGNMIATALSGFSPGDMFLGLSQTVTGAKTFNNGTFNIRNPGNTFSYNFVGSAITASRNVTIPLLTANDNFVMQAFAQGLTNKTISSSNVIGAVTMTLGSDAANDLYYRNGSGILTRLANGTTGQFLSANTGSAPSWSTPAGGGDMLLASVQTVTGAKLFNTGTLGMRNPANTFTYNFLGSAITANRNVTIPLLTADDVFMMNGFAATNTGVKTFNNGTFLMRNVANTFSSGFTNTNTAARTYTLPDLTGTVLLGTGTNNQVAYFDSGNSVKGEPAYNYNEASDLLTVPELSVTTEGSFAGAINAYSNVFYKGSGNGLFSTEFSSNTNSALGFRTKGTGPLSFSNTTISTHQFDFNLASANPSFQYYNPIDAIARTFTISATNNTTGPGHHIVIKSGSGATGVGGDIILETGVGVAPTGNASVKYSASGSFKINGLVEPILLSGTTLTLSDDHRGKVIYCTSSSPITITVPSGLPLGFNCVIWQDGTGAVTLSASGTTLNGKVLTTGQFDSISILHYKATETYLGN